MNEMTNEQYADAKETLIRYIAELVKHSNDLGEAVQKIEALLKK